MNSIHRQTVQFNLQALFSIWNAILVCIWSHLCVLLFCKLFPLWKSSITFQQQFLALMELIGLMTVIWSHFDKNAKISVPIDSTKVYKSVRFSTHGNNSEFSWIDCSFIYYFWKWTLTQHSVIFILVSICICTYFSSHCFWPIFLHIFLFPFDRFCRKKNELFFFSFHSMTQIHK